MKIYTQKDYDTLIARNKTLNDKIEQIWKDYANEQAKSNKIVGALIASSIFTLGILIWMAA